MKHYTHKLTALLLAALIMVSPVAQYACAEEAVYHTETKYPLLADVRDQLDEDEIVAAYDVVIDMGDYFNPADVSAFKVEKTNQSTDKVEVSFFSAHATDGTAFTSDMPGSYFAYYVARPVSGHPTYEVSRRITVNVVEEPAVPVVPETVETFQEDESADEDSEDDPYEESEIDDPEEAAFDDEGESEEEYDDAEEFPQGGDVSEETDAEEDLSEWEEESDEDGDTDLGGDEYAGEYDDDEHSDEDLTSEDWDEADDDFADEDYDDAGSDEDYYDDPEGDDFDDEGEEDSIDESDDEDESVDDTADENDTPSDDEEGISEDEDSEEAETAPEPSPDPTFDMPQIYDEPIESPEPTDTVGEDIPADIPAGIDETPGDGDEAPSEGITAGTEEEPPVEDEAEPSEAYTLPVDQIIMTVLEPTLSLASVDGGEGDDDATEEEDDMEEIDPDNIVLEGDAKMVRGSKVTYPRALGSWSTFKYTVDGKMAYCLESSKTSPKGGSFAQEILDSNPNLTKTLYYGYGGPGDLSASFYPDYSANVRYILTHIAASYFFTGSYSSATKGCSSSGLKKYRVQEWIDYIAGLEDPPSPGISLSDKSLEVTGITGGVQTTSSTTLNADHRNTITLALPDNVTYHNESTGETQTGGTVTIGGGTTFHFSAPTSVSGTWKTGDMKGMIAMIWKVLVVKTGTKTQKLGSYEGHVGHHHGGAVWPYDRNLSVFLCRRHPLCHHEQSGVGTDRQQLSARTAGAGVPGLLHHGVRGDLRRAGLHDADFRQHALGAVRHRGLHRHAVLRAAENRQPVQVRVQRALITDSGLLAA